MKQPVSFLLVMLNWVLFTHCSPSNDQSDASQADKAPRIPVSEKKSSSNSTTVETKPIGFFEISYGDKVYKSEHLNQEKSRIYVANTAENPFLQVDLVADSSANVSLQVRLYHHRWYKESATGVYNEYLSGNMPGAKKEGYQISFPVPSGNSTTKDTVVLTEGKVTLTTYQEGMVVGTFDGKGQRITKNGGPLLPLKGEFKLETSHFSTYQ